MSAPAPQVPAAEIPRMSIRGVDAATARALGPALEVALTEAVRSGRMPAGHRGALRLRLPAGATARDIARAVARAIEGG